MFDSTVGVMTQGGVCGLQLHCLPTTTRQMTTPHMTNNARKIVTVTVNNRLEERGPNRTFGNQQLSFTVNDCSQTILDFHYISP